VNDFTIRQIFPNGRYKLLYQKKTKGESESQQVKIVQSEAEVLVAHIKQYCQEHYDNPRMICLPPLPDATGLPLFSLLNKHPVYSRWQMGIGWDQSNMSPAHRLSIPLGMIDNPAEQEQKPFFLDLTDGDGNFVVVGPAGSGKALFLRSLVLGLALTHPPSELIFYFLSQGPTLSIFEDLPHCQAFIQPAETERIMRFFSLLEYEIERRTELMRASRVDSLTSVRLSQPEDLMPTIVIIFDNFGGFSSMHYNRLKDVENLAAVARQVDIHLVLSVGALNSIHWKIQQNISNRLGLGKVNTLEIFRRQAKVLPAKPGRGYIVEDNNILECQIASPTPLPQLDTGNATTITDMSDIISAVNSSWEWPNDQHPLPPILKLPQYIELSSLWESGQVSSEWYDKPTAPIGMDYNLEKVWIELNVLEPYNLVVGPPQSGKTEFLLTLALASAKNLPPSQLDIYIIAPKQNSNLRLLKDLPQVQFVGTVRSAKRYLSDLEKELKERALEQKELTEPTSSGTLPLTAYSPKRTLILIDDVQRFSRDKEASQILDNCMEYGNAMSTIYLFAADTGNNVNQAKQDFNSRCIQAVFRSGSGVAFSTEGGDFALLNLGLKVSPSVVKQHGPDIGRGRGFWVHNTEPRIVQFARAGEETASKADYESAVRQLVDVIIDEHQSDGQRS
jgi:S-DNA-T family DNA segregation ATPase FtsK/SpoIIIE